MRQLRQRNGRKWVKRFFGSEITHEFARSFIVNESIVTDLSWFTR